MKWITIAAVILCMSAPAIALSEDLETALAPQAPEAKKDPAPADTSIMLGVIAADYALAGSSEPSRYCNLVDGKSFSKNQVVIIAGTYSCESSYPKETVPFYKIMVNGKVHYVKQSDVTLEEKDRARLAAMPESALPKFEERAKNLSEYIEHKKLVEAIKAVEKIKKHGIVLIDHSIYDTSEYTDGTGFKVKVLNPTNKVIKYVSFTVVGYNAVHDPVRGPKRSTSITVKGIGPIEKNRTASYDWEYLWFTDLVESHKLLAITLQYMDGSKKTIKNIKEITLAPEHVRTIFED
jgi:hypothetical protein